MPLVPMTGLVDRVLSAYNQYQSFPILQRARISPALPQTGAANWSIESEWEQKDVVRGEKFNFSQHHFLTMDNSNPPIVNISCLTGPQLTSLGQGFPFPKENGAKVVWNIFTSTLRAICITYERTVSMKTASPVTQACCPASGTFVQLWNHGQFVKTIQLPSTGSTALHGRVYPLEDGNTFGGACWSHDSKKIVYTAEAPTSDESSDTAAKSSPFHYRENWGEGLQDTQRTVLCLLDIDSEHVQSLVDEKRLPDMTPTQPIWCPGDTGIVFAAYAMGPYRLGLKYCQQRPCQLFYLELETKRISTLSALDKSAGCPRFSPDGRNLVWLENSVGGPHMQCRALMHLNWPVPPLGTASPTPVVPVVDQPEKRGGFPGLYMNLPRRCWTSDSSHVILSTKWGFEEVMLIVPITCPAQTPRVYPIASPLDSEGPSSVTVMDVCHDIVVAGISSPIRPPFLGVLPLPNDSTELKQSSNFKWTIITPGSPEATLPVISNVGYSILRSPDLTNCSESLLIRSNPDAFQSSESDRMEHAPAEFKSPALIVWPHGGPHAAFSASWEPMISGFIQLGFACLLVNYRGSLGYGDAAVNSLLGHIGDMDVKDCVEATECALDTLELKFTGNRPKVYLFGGSHGGFLVLHLAAISGSQLKFKAVVARNPVANLISMCDTSDIPDWDYTEAGLTDGLWPMGSILDSVGLEKVSSVSPITRLNSDWTVPLLMLLGEQDRRVPSSQGLTFCRRLKALNPSVPCEIIVYPHDAHPLDSPITAKDVFLRAMLWFLKHP